MTEKTKPNCYDCVHRGEVPGDAHSRCNHPAFGEVKSNPLSEVLSIFASVGRVAPIQADVPGITVKGNPHGIRRGWFNHPWNFDPVWLEECDGFKPKGQP